MKIYVFSDTHGDRTAMEKVLAKSRPNVLIHLGDGDNDALEVSYQYPDVRLVQVSGNCDPFSEAPKESLTSIGGKTFFLTHGHQYNVKSRVGEAQAKAVMMKADFLLYGHTHKPMYTVKNNLHILNPGANTTFGIINIIKGAVKCNIFDTELWLYSLPL